MPKLIISDIMMPDLSGADVATTHIPVIFLSAVQTALEQQQGGSDVADNIIFAKLDDINVLVTKIN